MTQPNDPRRVKVIVELIDHTSAIAELNDRGDLVGTAGRGPGADHRPADPGGDRRPAQAGQEPAAQLAAEHAGGPGRRRRDHGAGHRRDLRRAAVGAADRLGRGDGGADRRRSTIPIADISNDLRRAPQAGGREVLRVEVSAPSPLLKGGLAFIDTPGRRRPRPAAPVGDARPAARRRRDADGQRHQPGVHRTRDAVHPPGARDLPGGGDRRHQDRPVPALARDRRDQRRAPAAGRPRDSDDPGVVAAAQPRDRDSTTRNSTRSRTSRRSSNSSPTRCCPARTTGSATRCSPKYVRPQSILTLSVNSELSALNDPDDARAAHRGPGAAQGRRPRTHCSRPRCGSRSSTTASPT